MVKLSKIAAVIAVHNRLNLTKRCIKSIYNSLGLIDTDLFIVDDGSIDGTYEWIKKNYPKANIQKGNGNLWFGRAMHLGISEVFKTKNKYDFIFIINNDTFLKKEALKKMIKVSDKRNVVSLNFYQEDLYSGGTSGFVWDKWKGLEGVCYRKEWENIKNSEFVRVNSVSTTATLYPINFLRNIEKINVERHPHHRYDIMLSSICKSAGAKFLVSTSFLANHRRCNEDRLDKPWYKYSFLSYFSRLFLNPLDNAYILGLIESNIAIAPKFYSSLFVNLKILIFSLTKLLILLIKSLIIEFPRSFLKVQK